MQISEISVPPQSPSNLGVALECRLTLQLFFCKPGLHPCYHIRTKSGGHTCKSLHLGGRGGGSEAQGLSQLHGGQALLHETWPQSNKQTTTSNNSQTPPKSAEAVGLKSLCRCFCSCFLPCWLVVHCLDRDDKPFPFLRLPEILQS